MTSEWVSRKPWWLTREAAACCCYEGGGGGGKHTTLQTLTHSMQEKSLARVQSHVQAGSADTSGITQALSTDTLWMKLSLSLDVRCGAAEMLPHFE